MIRINPKTEVRKGQIRDMSMVSLKRTLYLGR